MIAVIFRFMIITTFLILSQGFNTTGLRNLKGNMIKDVRHLSVIALWPEGTAGINPDIQEKVKPQNKRFYNIHNPNITVYKPEISNGTSVIICSGGGYNYVATGVEGIPTAEKLNKEGITVFVLKYRLPNTPSVNFKHPVPLSDALRAIQLVRHHAKDFDVDPERIGIMGFSAGGHLASTTGTLFSDYTFGTDAISKEDSRPDFMCLVYPVITTQAKGYVHGCTRSLIGGKPSQESLLPLSSELNVTAKTPPTFLVHAKDDQGVKYQNSVLMYEALRKHGIPSELKLYEKGGHGFGLGREGTDSVKWTDDFIDWLRRMKLI